MGILAENNQFFKGKIPIISEYSDQHRAMLSTIASRGFTSIPGFLFEASIGLETQAKIKISNLNYQVTADAIERELKQTGHDYSQTYKAARIAFELNKQTLLTALRQEFADIDATQSLKEEELNRLFIELDIRRLILITTKTAIELEMEQARRDLSETDRLTFNKESELVSEQVITATKKLEVIPHINAILLVEQSVLVEEQANAVHARSLLDEKKLLLDKKDEILPLIEEKADEQEFLAAALGEQIEFQKLILTAAIEKLALQTNIVDNEVDILDAQILVEDMRQLLLEQKHALQENVLEKEKEFIAKDTENLGLIDTQRSTTLTQLQNDKVDLRSDREDTEDTILDADILRAETIKTNQVQEEKWLLMREKTTRVKDITDSANASATADITSKLIHLIGS